MRKLLGLALAAGAFTLVVPHAQASVTCYGAHAGTTYVDVCAGSWCPDVCFVEAYVDCDINALPVKASSLCPVGFHH